MSNKPVFLPLYHLRKERKAKKNLIRVSDRGNINDHARSIIVTDYLNLLNESFIVSSKTKLMKKNCTIVESKKCISDYYMITIRILNRLLRRYKQDEYVERKKRCGRPRLMTKKNEKESDWSEK